MGTVANVLRRHGLDVDESVLAAEVDHWLLALASDAGTAALTQEQEGILEAGGLPTVAAANAAARETAQAAAEFTALLASSWSARQVAAALDVHETWVRQLSRQGRLWWLSSGRSRVFPRSQFAADPTRAGGARVPAGLAEVLAALPPDLHPLSVHSALTAPRTELDGRSVVQWLTEGADPLVAVDAVAGAALLT